MSDDRRRCRRGTSSRRGSNNNQREPSRREPREEKETMHTPPPRPIILAKPDRREPDSATTIKQVDNAIIMVKTRDDSNSKAGVKSISPSELYRVKTLQSTSPVPVSHDGLSPQFRLTLPAPMSQSVKLLDESLQWSDSGMDYLLDQTDYFVVGVVGLENSGKSTILSMLAGCGSDEESVFKTHDECDHTSYHTVGIDMYVASNRVIFLDTQPTLSASVLDQNNRVERKFAGEYNTGENQSEIQSLQMISFLYTVCNVVLVVQDWFTDVHLLKLLLTAELLRPNIPSLGNEVSPEHDEFVPHLVFINNKSETNDFSSDSVDKMTQTIGKCFQKSKLRYEGGVSMTMGTFPNLTTKTVPSDVNLFLLPCSQDGKACDPLSVMLPEYKAHPGLDEMIRLLRNQVFQLARQPFTTAPLTERNWFHYTARIWETVKKSQLYAEYTRLLP